MLWVGEAGKRLQIETNSQQMLIFISDLGKKYIVLKQQQLQQEWIIKQM